MRTNKYIIRYLLPNRTGTDVFVHNADVVGIKNDTDTSVIYREIIDSIIRWQASVNRMVYPGDIDITMIALVGSFTQEK